MNIVFKFFVHYTAWEIIIQKNSKFCIYKAWLCSMVLKNASELEIYFLKILITILKIL